MGCSGSGMGGVGWEEWVRRSREEEYSMREVEQDWWHRRGER